LQLEIAEKLQILLTERVWIPAPSTHSTALRAGSAQDRFRRNDKLKQLTAMRRSG